MSWDRERLLALCAAKAKRGWPVVVDAYSYRDEQMRRVLFRMAKDGTVKQFQFNRKQIFFYRPEDAPLLEREWGSAVTS